jgi:YHS domain-containing protein
MDAPHLTTMPKDYYFSNTQANIKFNGLPDEGNKIILPAKG